jgi:hypothetical protein
MSKHFLFGFALMTALVASTTLAQNAPPQQPQGGPSGAPGGPGGGPGGRPDFAAMQQQFNQRIKEMLESTDDEWKALEPRIESVRQLQRDASSRGFGPGPGGPPGGGPGGPGAGAPTNASAQSNGPGPNAPANQSPIQQASSDLRTVLENNEASAEDIKAKVAALRDARAKAKADLAKAQDDLRELVTARQEATLVVLGILE